MNYQKKKTVTLNLIEVWEPVISNLIKELAKVVLNISFVINYSETFNPGMRSNNDLRSLLSNIRKEFLRLTFYCLTEMCCVLFRQNRI